MKNFAAERKKKFFFFMKHIFFCILIWVLSFLTIIFISKLYGRIILGLSVLTTFIYLAGLNVLYSKNTEYSELKRMFEEDKNEFVKLFQKTFIRFFLPILIVGFILNLAIFHNLFVNILFLILGYLFFFIYINIKLIDILLAKRKRWNF